MGAFRLFVLTLLSCGLSCIDAGGTSDATSIEIKAQHNTELSRMMSRLEVVETAGFSTGTGDYFVKVFRIPLGEECETESSLCVGERLLVSASSPDLYGDNALYELTGLGEWEFIEWTSFSEGDAPEYSTSFVVKVFAREGQDSVRCGGVAVPSGSQVTLAVNPWNAVCTPSE